MTTSNRPEMHSTTDRPTVIRTPDQRLRVFVSSTLGELAEERRAVRRAIEELRLTPVMFELSARAHPPRDLYRSYLAQSEVFVGVYWQSYGWTAPDMGMSGVEDEYRLAGGLPRLLYVKEPAPDREPGLAGLIERIEDDSYGSYRIFADAEELAELVRTDLAVLLSERFFDTRAVETTATVTRPAASRLPVPSTPLIGRDADVVGVLDLLALNDVRLVTLSGPGGIGKTRLAVAVAEALAASQEIEVAFAALASVRDPGLVLPTIAAEVGASTEHGRPPLDALVDHFAGRPTLLVLDNLEQVVDAGPQLAELLALVPTLTVLATSRRILRLRGEHEYPVPALGVLPAAESSWAEQMGRAPAVALFVERARAVRHDFELTGDNALAVAELCRRLDGLPLAIELAAARIRLLSPQQLLQRLGNRLDALGSGASDLPDRQRTLRATVAWSYDLLEPVAADTLAALGVFVDGFTLQAAGRVCGLQDLEVLDVLDELAGHSMLLVHPSSTGEPRFRMLETVREFAVELLAERDDAEELTRRHAAYFRDLVEEADPYLRGIGQLAWVAVLSDEQANLRRTFAWLHEHDELAGVARLARILWLYWWLDDRIPEGRDCLAPALERLDEVDDHTAANLLWTSAAIALEVGDDAEAQRCALGALEIQDQVDDPFLVGVANLLWSMIVPTVNGDLVEELRYARRALTLFEESGEVFLTGLAHTILGTTHLMMGDAAAARGPQEQARLVGRQLGNDRLVAQATHGLALVALVEGDLEECRRLLAECAPMFAAMESSEGLGLVLSAYAHLAMAEDDPWRAAVSLAGAHRLRARAQLVPWPTIKEFEQALADRIASALGVERAAEAASVATMLDVDGALRAARARAVDDAPAMVGTDAGGLLRTHPSGLQPSERDRETVRGDR